MNKQLMKWMLCLSVLALPLLSINTLAAAHGGHGGGGHGGGGYHGGGSGYHGGGGSWNHGGGNWDHNNSWNRGNNWNGQWYHNRDYGNYWGPGWGSAYYYNGYPSVNVDVDGGYTYPQTDSGTTYYYSE